MDTWDQIAVACPATEFEMAAHRPAAEASWIETRRSVRVRVDLLVLAALALAGCSPTAKIVQLPPPEVTVALPVQRQVVDATYATGRTEGSEFVEERARVSGYLSKIYFKPGSLIKQGDPLFEIDDRPYRTALEQAEGELERVQARLRRTELDLERGEKNFSRNVIAKEEFDRLVADKAEATAAVHTAEAAVDRAQLDLSWTKVNAPISGLVSRELITVGNLVVADQTLLTTILRYDPMYVYFDVDENTVLQVQKLIREGKFKTARQNRVPIRMGLSNDVGYPLEGYINFVENRVDRTTGTMEVRGEFANPMVENDSFRISAGLFARIRMDLGAPYDALLVPERALLSDQDKKFVYVIDDQQKAVRHYVKLGQSEGGYRVVREGLSAADRVVVNGIQRLTDGLVVKSTEETLPGPAADSVEKSAAASEPPPTETPPVKVQVEPAPAEPAGPAPEPVQTQATP